MYLLKRYFYPLLLWAILDMPYFIFIVTHIHLRLIATTCHDLFRPSPKPRRGTWRLLVNARIWPQINVSYWLHVYVSGIFKLADTFINVKVWNPKASQRYFPTRTVFRKVIQVVLFFLENNQIWSSRGNLECFNTEWLNINTIKHKSLTPETHKRYAMHLHAIF